MNPSSPSVSLATLQREQMRLRLWLAALLLIAICLFALTLSWLAQAGPLQPLLKVKTSMIALLTVYSISVGVAATYARWIRVRREPAVRAVVETNR